MSSPSPRNPNLLLAWGAMLVISDLPEILGRVFLGSACPWLALSKILFLAAFLALCLLREMARPLWQYAFILLVFQLALSGSSWLQATSWWQGEFASQDVSFTVAYLDAFIRDLGVAVVVIAALWLAKRDRCAFFLTKGRLDAPIRPVRWLGIGEGESWRTFGWIFAGAATIGVSIPVALSISFSPETLRAAAALMPACILFAAVNAFTEEVYFRASILATLETVVGRNHALAINVVFFGLAHYLYGSPSGLVGFLMTGFLAFLLGKGMLETRGLAWPWFIHFAPDVVIFASYAVLWVQ